MREEGRFSAEHRQAIKHCEICRKLHARPADYRMPDREIERHVVQAIKARRYGDPRP